jgi:hypothetical protein
MVRSLEELRSVAGLVSLGRGHRHVLDVVALLGVALSLLERDQRFEQPLLIMETEEEEL